MRQPRRPVARLSGVVIRRAVVAGLALLALAAAAVGAPAAAPPPPSAVPDDTADGGGSGPPALVPVLPQPARQSGPPTPAAPPPPREVSVTMGGDLLWHDLVWLSAQADHRRTGRGYGGLDLDPMFRALRPLVRGADLAICHEEVPFAGRGEPWESYPLFAAPPQIARWIGDFGWDACVTSSNHSVDQGFAGLRRTATLLARAGVRHVGTFRTPAERRRPVVLETEEGVRVGLVSGTYGLNGLPLPEGRPWSVSLWQARNLLDQARAARAAGADIVLVSVHWGLEYTTLPDAAQVALARRLTASPAVDLVFGEHAHVVQPITRVNGKWVVYGTGNMIAAQETSRPETYEGISVRFTFRERPDGGWAVRQAEYLPHSWSSFLGGQPIRITRDVSAETEARVRAAVHALGGTRGLVER